MPTLLRPELPPQVDEVFARVLAKRPDERYQSCREFVEAARIALGIFGPGTEPSMAFGTMAVLPQTGPPPDRQAGAPPDRFSWSSLASQSRGSDLVDPVAPGNAAAASGQPWGGQSEPSQPGSSQPSASQAGSGRHGANQPGANQPGGTLTSHRREPGMAGPGEPGQPVGAQPPPGRPREPRWYRQPRWLAILGALVLVIAGTGVYSG